MVLTWQLVCSEKRLFYNGAKNFEQKSKKFLHVLAREDTEEVTKILNAGEQY